MNCYRCGCQPCECKDGVTLYHGDCRDVLPLIGPVGRCVTDPPYGLEFMGKGWDHGVPVIEFWQAISGALLPGAMCLAFGGTRTFHRLAVAIEDAGFEIRDTVMWVYGSGFPKSLDISKAIDKAAGAEREVVGFKPSDRPNRVGRQGGSMAGVETRAVETAPATDAAKLWQGYGTALKPAWEPIIVAMKPLDGTFSDNAIEHGVAGINVDGGRVGTEDGLKGGQYSGKIRDDGNCYGAHKNLSPEDYKQPQGRFPANLIHDGSEEVLGLFPETDASKSGGKSGCNANPMSWGEVNPNRERIGHNDNGGSAARFFKCCPPDIICQLCYRHIAPRHVTTSASQTQGGATCKQPHASNAKRPLSNIRATIASIAPKNVTTTVAERIAQNVPYAESLCDSCATVIALGLVETKTSGSSSEVLRRILDSIGSCNASILTRNLASFAVLWVNIGTIPTTESLSILCGSVLHAIDESTRQGARVVAEGGSDREKATRFRYAAKASASDRGHMPEESLPLFNETFPEFRNTHPTVKPVELMKYLLTLTDMPTDMGLVDPFAGSGTTGVAAKALGMRCILIEKEKPYCQITATRLE